MQADDLSKFVPVEWVLYTIPGQNTCFKESKNRIPTNICCKYNDIDC
jgi:hypothetical protein